VAVTGQLPTGPTGALDAVSALVGAPAELLVRIISLAPIGVGLVDPDGRTVVTNDALRQMLGYSEEEFAELDFRTFTHPDDVARNDELFAQLMAGEIDRFDLDKRFLHRDGHVVWGRLLVAAIETADDGTAGDRAAPGRHRAAALQAELAAAEASYRLMVEQVPAVVYGDTDPGAPELRQPPAEPDPRLRARGVVVDPGTVAGAAPQRRPGGGPRALRGPPRDGLGGAVDPHLPPASPRTVRSSGSVTSSPSPPTTTVDGCSAGYWST
jgi:PAS domain S-box-containing protein